MIVWAPIHDRNGVFKANPRPLLLISINPAAKNGPFVAHAISTRKEHDEMDPGIVMPWHPKTGAGCGLYEWCALVLKWLVFIYPADIVKPDDGIYLSVPPEFLMMVKDALAEMHSRP